MCSTTELFAIVITLVIIFLVIWMVYLRKHVMLFYRPTCGACRAFMPKWKLVKEKLSWLNYRITEVNTDDPANYELVAKYKIATVPDIWIVDRHGKTMKYVYNGPIQADDLLNFIQKV